MNNIGGQYYYISRICLGLLFLCVLSTQVSARSIAFFFDPSYVDIQNGNVFSEASNLSASLEELGHEVVYFTDFRDIIGADFDLVIIPELEKNDLVASSPDQLTAYRNYVEDGGSIIVLGVVASDETQNGNAIKFMNNLSGRNLKIGEPILEGTCIKDDSFEGNDFNAAPNEINNNNAVVFITQGLRNIDQTIYYKEGDPSKAAVAQLSVGKGSLVYFGWGWWNASPIGTQDGGWLSLLDVSIENLACDGPELQLERDYEFSLNLGGFFELENHYFENSATACTSFQFHFSKNRFECKDVNKVHQVDISIEDELERTITQTVNIVIVDDLEVCDLLPQSAQLTGSFETFGGAPLEDVIMTLESEVIEQYASDSDGNIAIDLSLIDDYTLSLYKQTSTAKQVTTNDFSLLQRHILGIQKFDSPYQFLAADVNGDLKLDIQDLHIIKKLVLNEPTDDEIPSNWLWVRKDFLFVDGVNPFMQNWNTIHGESLKLDDLDLMIIGIKIGDIDASYRD